MTVSLQGSQSAVELYDSIEAWLPNSPQSVGHGGSPQKKGTYEGSDPRLQSAATMFPASSTSVA